MLQRIQYSYPFLWVFPCEVKLGDEVEINLTYFDHDKKRLHFKMEMIEKSSKKLSATIELLSLYVNLKERKVSESCIF